MRKMLFVFVGLAVFLPGMAHSDLQVEIARLASEKQRKITELEGCTKSAKGLQIAGVSTLGLTAAGVALNAKQASDKKSLVNQIASTNAQIEKTRKTAEDKAAKQAEKEAAEKSKNKGTAKTKVDCESELCAEGTPQATADKKGENTEGQLNSGRDSEYVKWKKENPDIKQGDSCECSKNYPPTKYAKTCEWDERGDAFICSPTACEDNNELKDGTCVPEKTTVTCDREKGEVLDYYKDSCEKCTGNNIAKDDKCQECPKGYKPNSFHSDCDAVDISKNFKDACLEISGVLAAHSICEIAEEDARDAALQCNRMYNIIEGHAEIKFNTRSNGTFYCSL